MSRTTSRAMTKKVLEALLKKAAPSVLPIAVKALVDEALADLYPPVPSSVVDTGGNGLRIHPRTFVVQTAQAELMSMMLTLTEKHNLSLMEEATILHQALASPLRYLMRWDRHGNTNKKADEA